jgi:hypothetical protein
MARDSHTLSEIADELSAIDGIKVNRTDMDTDNRILVKVMDEDAVGSFFGLRRRLGFDSWAVTRNCFDYTVLDAFVSTE